MGDSLFATDEIRKNSVAWNFQRANEKYNPDASVLRTQIANDNQFGILIRHDPYSASYRKYFTAFGRGRTNGECTICE